MSTRPKKRGFASLTKAQLRKVSSKGGSKKVPKGVALLPVEVRRERAREAARIRWEKSRRESDTEAINSQEDGRLNEQSGEDHATTTLD